MWFILIRLVDYVSKNQIMTDQVEDPISPGALKQQKQTSIRGEILGREFDHFGREPFFAQMVGRLMGVAQSIEQNYG